jgi:hypothetical protein
VHYASVKAELTDSFLCASFAFPDERVASYSLDSVEYAISDTARVVANVPQHVLVLKRDAGQSDTLSLVLTTLPLVSLTNISGAAFSSDYVVRCNFRLVDPHCRTNGQQVFESTATAGYRGASSAFLDKKSFKINLVTLNDNPTATGGTQVEEERDETLMGIRETDSYILDAATIDYSRMRNRVCFDLWNEMATLRDGDMVRNGTKGCFCEMFLNGEYNGLFCFSDKVNRSLLGLKKTKLEEGGKLRGVLYKCKAASDEPHFLRLPDAYYAPGASECWYDWYLRYPKDNFTAQCWEPLLDVLNRTNHIGTSPDSVAEVLSCFYEDNFVEYAVFAMSVQLLDNFMHNAYLSCKDYTKSCRMWITPWDMDASLGRDGASSLIDQVATPKHVFQDAHPFRPYYDQRVEPFWSKYVALWRKLHDGGPLSSSHVAELVDSYRRQIEQSGTWTRERQRWNNVLNFWNNSPLELRESLQDEARYITDWYARNESSLNEAIDAITAIGPAAVQPRAAATTNRIYRLDGSVVRASEFGSLPRGIYIVNGRKVVR